MGGRGGSFDISNEKPVSKLMSKVYFNGAKKSDALRGSGNIKKDAKLEKIISSGNVDYFKGIKTKEEAERTMNYLNHRNDEIERKLARLGSAEAVFKNQKIAIERRKLVEASNAMADAMHKFSKLPEKGNTNIHDPIHTTTTYKRWYKNNKKNFERWFFGSGK